MRGGALPPALLLAALALSLAFAPANARWRGAAAAALAGLPMVWAPLPVGWTDAVFVGCWVSLVLTALCVHLPGGLGPRAALALSANAGLWSGATVAVAGEPLDFLKAAVAFGLLPVAGWALQRPVGAIAVKTVASWLVAVGVLIALLPVLSTPGYVADHMQ